MITESASSTKIPPINGSSSSCLIMMATVPMAPPSASEPTSPIKISAGCALYQRNPILEPTMAPQKTVSSATCGIFCSSRYSENTACPLKYVRIVSAPAAITVQPMARPSSPSVRFTALLDPTSTSITKSTNGVKASHHKCG